MKRVKKLPKTDWDIGNYDLDFYGYGEVDIFVNEKGAGERVNCIFRIKDYEKYDDDNCFDHTFAILCNDCGVLGATKELQGLNAGQIIPVKFNGANNPELPLNWIKSQFWKL